MAIDTAPAPAPTSAPTDGPAIAIVRVPKPWYLPRAVVRRVMAKTIGQYASLPGLAFKAYSIEQQSGAFGGLYHWTSMARARAWFSPAWHERVRKQRGVQADVLLLDAPVTLDNVAGGVREQIGGPAVATLVQMAVPAGTPRELIVQEFNRQLPQLRCLDGLLRKHLLIGEDGTVGGLYLWRDAACAHQWFSPAWHERVRSTYGIEPTLTEFEVPILLPTRDAANRPAPGAEFLAAAA